VTRQYREAEVPGNRHGNIPASRGNVYVAIRDKLAKKVGYDRAQQIAARIAHEGTSKAGRKAMGRKAARTRKSRRR
jgi:hypothetical protein